MTDSRLLAFIGLAALLTVTPGADMALVTRNALANGRRAALWTALGINSGLLFWAVASGAGLAALLTASTAAFTALKLAGAAYLLLLGIRTILQTRTRHAIGDGNTPDTTTAYLPLGGRAAYRQGLLNNMLNPKVGVFYTTSLPQFIGPGDPLLLRSLLLGGVHIVLGLTWLSCYALLVTRAGAILRSASVRRAIDRVTGSVLIAFGLRLATTSR